jgi:hypothetical protein
MISDLGFRLANSLSEQTSVLIVNDVTTEKYKVPILLYRLPKIMIHQLVQSPLIGYWTAKKRINYCLWKIILLKKYSMEHTLKYLIFNQTKVRNCKPKFLRMEE